MNLNTLSWENSLKIVTLLQKRLVKAVYVKDFSSVFKLQKIILQSNSGRLLSIRYVTQLCPLKKIPGLDSKLALTFLERFELNEVLKIRFSSWENQSLKKVNVTRKDGIMVSIQVPSISDRAWQYLIVLAIEPTNYALSHPRFFCSRTLESMYKLQRCVVLNLSKASLGLQKRVLNVELTKTFVNYNKSYLIDKLLASRSIKLSIIRLLCKGFHLQYQEENFVLRYKYFKCNK